MLKPLSITLTDGEELTDEQKRALEPLLASRGFSIAASVRATRLPSDEGFLLTQ
jgi:hypothetical protein